MSDQRERLAKLSEEIAVKLLHSHPYAAKAIEESLLAAGVTLPPEPPRLVTEEMLNEASKIRGGSQRYWTIELEGASALVESAIRRAVERKTDGDHVRLDADGKHCAYIQHVSTRSLLALFGLDGGVP